MPINDLLSSEILNAWEKNTNNAPDDVVRNRRKALTQSAILDQPIPRANVPLARGMGFVEGGRRFTESLRAFLGEMGAPYTQEQLFSPTQGTETQRFGTKAAKLAKLLPTQVMESLRLAADTWEVGTQTDQIARLIAGERTPQGEEYLAQALLSTAEGAVGVGGIGGLKAGDKSLAMISKALEKNYFAPFTERGGGRLAKEARPILQEELLARGPRPKFEQLPVSRWGDPEFIAVAGERAKSELLRAPWYHGRGTFPWKGRTQAQIAVESTEAYPSLRGFGKSRFQRGNIGEPSGMSLSASPETAREFAGLNQRSSGILSSMRSRELAAVETGPESSEKIASISNYYRRLYDLYAGQIARILPRYGGPPEEKILDVSNLAKATGPLQRAYGKAVEDFVTSLRGSELRKAGRTALELEAQVERDLTSQTASHTLYENVLKPGVFEDNRLFKRFNEAITTSLKSEGYEGLLYSPHRYGEYEMRLFDPSRAFYLDIARGIEQTPKIAQRLREWRRATVPEPKGSQSLRHFYKDVDLLDIFLRNIED